MIRERTGNFTHSWRFCCLSSSESPLLYWPSSTNSLLHGTGNFDQASGNSNSLIDFRSAKAIASQTVSSQSRRHAGHQPAGYRNRFRKFPWQQNLATRYARRTIRKSLVRADDQDREGIWHLGPRPRENMPAAGRCPFRLAAIGQSFKPAKRCRSFPSRRPNR